MVKRSRARRLGESAYGLLLLTRALAIAAVALVVLAAGAWVSWTHSRDALMPGLIRGTMAVRSCGTTLCSGPFTPDGVQAPRSGVTVQASAVRRVGERIEVAVRPGSDTAVRTGVAGMAYAWVPFAGALLLAALLIGMGLRMRRTAWGAVAVGAVLLATAFALN